MPVTATPPDADDQTDTDDRKLALIVGLDAETVDAAGPVLGGLAGGGWIIRAFDPGPDKTVLDLLDRYGVGSESGPGPWLESVTAVIPLLPAQSPDSWTATLNRVARLDRAITRARQTSTPTTPAEVCWIESVAPEDAPPALAGVYRQLANDHGKLHNLYRALSLQPAPIIPADTHYRAILHDPNLVSAPWFLELLASQAATLAGCVYALANHGENFINLLGDRAKGEAMLQALQDRDYDTLFDDRQRALLIFGELLCLRPHAPAESHIQELRDLGISDVEILESVQATACFAYWSRLINGIGINLGSESVGRFDLDRA